MKLLCRRCEVEGPMLTASSAEFPGISPFAFSAASELVQVSVEGEHQAGEGGLISRTAEIGSGSCMGISNHCLIPCPPPTIRLRQNCLQLQVSLGIKPWTSWPRD